MYVYLKCRVNPLRVSFQRLVFSTLSCVCDKLFERAQYVFYHLDGRGKEGIYLYIYIYIYVYMCICIYAYVGKYLYKHMIQLIQQE